MFSTDNTIRALRAAILNVVLILLVINSNQALAASPKFDQTSKAWITDGMVWSTISDKTYSYDDAAKNCADLNKNTNNSKNSQWTLPTKEQLTKFNSDIYLKPSWYLNTRKVKPRMVDGYLWFSHNNDETTNSYNIAADKLGKNQKAYMMCVRPTGVDTKGILFQGILNWSEITEHKNYLTAKAHCSDMGKGAENVTWKIPSFDELSAMEYDLAGTELNMVKSGALKKLGLNWILGKTWSSTEDVSFGGRKVVDLNDGSFTTDYEVEKDNVICVTPNLDLTKFNY